MSELLREIKPESLVGWTLNGKLKLFWREFILFVDTPGLIGVRRHDFFRVIHVKTKKNADKANNTNSMNV
jgi:hypothetical protein